MDGEGARPHDRAMLKVADLMTKSVLTLAPSTSIGNAIDTLATLAVSGAPVCDAENKVIGVFSKSDVVFDLSDGEIVLTDPISSTMSKDPLLVAVDAPIREAIRLMAEHRVHRLIATDESGSVVGIITPLDVVMALHSGTLTP